MERTGAESVSPKTGSAVLSQTFKLGSLTVRYYSITFVSAILVGYIVGRWRAKLAQLSMDVFDDIVFWTVLISFLCARIYYVLFYWYQYSGDLSEIYKIWHGGLAIYGALIGGVLTLLYLARKHKVNFFALLDIFAFALPLAQALGRLGNYFNYEAFGKPTNLPWKMFVPESFRPAGYANFSYFHPTFLYEMIWNILVFFALLLISRTFAKRKVSGPMKPGVIAGSYLVLYSIGRFFIEGIRLDSAYFGPFRGDQITAILLIFAGIAIIIRKYASPTV